VAKRFNINKAEKGIPLMPQRVHEYDLKDMFKVCKKKKDESLVFMVMPDTHYGIHCEHSINIFKKIGAEVQPDGLIHIGDYHDMGFISPHEGHKNDICRCVKTIKKGNKYMANILKSIGDPLLKFFCIGNHEYWWLRYLDKNIPDLEPALKMLNIDVSMESIATLQCLGFEAIPHNEFLKLGHAYFTHGLYTNDGHAKKMVNVVGGNVFYGHTESVQSYSQVSAKGLRMGVNIGTLRDPSLASFMRNKPHAWVNSFTIIEYRRNGEFSFQQVHIINGAACYNGKIYKG
jgi:hypothetical protein